MSNDGLRIEFDPEGRYALQIDAGGRIELCAPDAAGRRSPLFSALRTHLVFEVGSASKSFSGNPSVITLPADAQTLHVRLGRRAPFSICEVALAPAPRLVRGSYRLSPFETRYLSENGQPLPGGCLATSSPHGLQTDLHTHFAGCVSGEDLVEIAAECGARYPATLLAEAGMQATGESLLVADMPSTLRKRLAGHLSIPLDRQVTYFDMQRIYRLRRPFTKHPRAFVPLLRRIAADYARMGVRYAELSLTDIVEATRLRAAHREIPRIENETGVTLRFLAAIGRHDDLELDLDYIERIRQLAASRYVVGVDFLGHETNSTHAFSRQLVELASWAHEARPGFVLRVHAGENPAHPENVRAAVEYVAGRDVQLRIGHGLYGGDERTIERLRQTGTIVEFNLNSNFALNNIQSSTQVPIQQYVEHGVSVVLGSDGYGIYRTTLDLEAQAARLCGLGEAHFARLRAAELRYLSRRAADDARATAPPEAFAVPDDLPAHHYGPYVIERNREKKNTQRQALRDRLSELNVPPLADSERDDLLRDKQCVSFAGAWKRSWERVSASQREQIRGVVAELCAAWDAKRTVIITGGTQYGVESIVQEEARRRGIARLGALVWATPPEAIDAGHLTHSTIVGETLYDKAAGLYGLMRDHNGLCLFVGGGAIVSDEIQVAANLRLNYRLMDGPEGASTEHARHLPERSFRSAAEVLSALAPASLHTGDDSYRYTGANPTVDMVLIRANPSTLAREVLLIRRDRDARAEGGQWALPGGFVETDSPRGTAWIAGKESASVACVRELREETGLDICDLEGQLLRIGVYEGGGRDPRDSARAWSQSLAFALELPSERSTALVAGGDDASEARWFILSALPGRLAFDHARILNDGLQLLAARNVAQ